MNINLITKVVTLFTFTFLFSYTYIIALFIFRTEVLEFKIQYRTGNQLYQTKNNLFS